MEHSAETEWAGLFFFFFSAQRQLCVFMKVARACVGVWISHLQTLWFILSIFAYAHNVINCHALSFLLATSPCTHARPLTAQDGLCRRRCAFTDSHFLHTDGAVHSQNQMIKGNGELYSQRFWNTVLFTCTWTNAVGEPPQALPS